MKIRGTLTVRPIAGARRRRRTQAAYEKVRSQESTGTPGHRYLELHEESRFPSAPWRRLKVVAAPASTVIVPGRAGHSPSRSHGNTRRRLRDLPRARLG